MCFLRAKKVEGGVTTHYLTLGHQVMYEKAQGPDPLVDPVSTRHIFAGSQRIAEVRGGEVSYFHNDHLGSPWAVTSATGSVIAAVVATTPFGTPHATSSLTSYMFTGKDRDTTGLYYFAARYYDPAVGRFVTEDTWKGIIHQPASQNRYVYTINNPLRYVDPTGNTFFDVLYEWFTGGGGTSVSPSPQKPPAAGGGTGGGGGTGAPYRRTDDLDATQIPGGSGRRLSNPESTALTVYDPKLAAQQSMPFNARVDYYVTPRGIAIPAEKTAFYENMSRMTYKDGKYYGESSIGPIRVRIEDGHLHDQGYSGRPNPYHNVPHIHVEHKRHLFSGKWGEGVTNKVTFPQYWLME